MGHLEVRIDEYSPREFRKFAEPVLDDGEDICVRYVPTRSKPAQLSICASVKDADTNPEMAQA
eukprot:1248985-Karenia_brevis.AAC.1